MTRPLDNVTVVALEQALAAPFATRQLADLGARVIKIERPGEGDFARRYDSAVLGQSAYFVWVNRSKESLALDLKQPQAQRILAELLTRADVFVQNLAPGAVERLGFGAEALRSRHPRLITCNISGYGNEGPYREKKAYDLLVQAESGLISVTGTEEEMARPGISVADIAAGMYAFSGIQTALLLRNRTGLGTNVEVSLLDALAEWMGHPIYTQAYAGRAPRRSGPRHPTIAPYGPVHTGDGGTMLISVQNEREWRNLCSGVLERPDLADDQRYDTNEHRVANRPALEAEIDAVAAGMTTAELERRLDRHAVAFGRIRSMEEVLAHPQLRARDRWRTVQTPRGEVTALRPPAGI
ncbi:MAG: CoA transferase, partial [bacterium]|nr:CoA transferase [bacterium]